MGTCYNAQACQVLFPLQTVAQNVAQLDYMRHAMKTKDAEVEVLKKKWQEYQEVQDRLSGYEKDRLGEKDLLRKRAEQIDALQHKAGHKSVSQYGLLLCTLGATEIDASATCLCMDEVYVLTLYNNGMPVHHCDLVTCTMQQASSCNPFHHLVICFCHHLQANMDSTYFVQPYACRSC